MAKLAKSADLGTSDPRRKSGQTHGSKSEEQPAPEAGAKARAASGAVGGCRRQVPQEEASREGLAQTAEEEWSGELAQALWFKLPA